MSFTITRETVVAGVGAVAEGVSFGLFHGTALSVAEGVLLAATVLGVHVAPKVAANPAQDPVVTPSPATPPAAA